jgi:CheY-like chemotaxis protein
VDDERNVRDVLQALLKRRYEVTAAASVAEARERLTESGDWQLILCDLMMPMVTGMEVHAELAAAVPDQADRIVFLTGGAFTTHARDFLKRVPNDRFEKPFDGGRLRMLAKEMVDDAKPTSK